MKRQLFYLVLVMFPCIVWTQNRKEWAPLDSTYQACLLARQALQGETASKVEMKEASQLYVKIFQLYNIPIIDHSYTDLAEIDGHIRYLPSFFDDLSKGRKIYEEAKKYRESNDHRGKKEHRQIKVTNLAIKKNGRLVMQYQPNEKKIGFAMVTEPKRLMTMYVEAFNDKGQKLGERIQRHDAAYKGYAHCLLKDIHVLQDVAYFKITVQNKSKRDSSFVIIISD